MVKTVDRQCKVLVLDADTARAAELSHRLRFLNYEPVIAGAGCRFNKTDVETGIAVMIGETASNQHLTDLLQKLSLYHPELPHLVLSGESPDAAAEPKKGTYPIWKVDQPVRRSQVSRLLRRAERYAGKDRRQRLTGTSHSIQNVRQLIEQVAEFITSVLVTGESGTGKELVARTIHDLSDRADRPFVPINCGAIPAELLESELFGHDKGAFTGAINDRTGRFELAEGGTLFLDEIGDMSLPMQVKLLRVLQERSFERVGSNKTRPCNVRIVAATHRNLPAAVENGDFREDLFYRLNVFPIEMPCLRKRTSDLPDLLDELLLEHQGQGQSNLRVTPRALQALATYAWPGNIRELSNLVERLAILKPSGDIELADLPAKYRESVPGKQLEGDDKIVSESLAITNANLKAHLQAVERDFIRQAMLVSDGVVAKAARLLKMQRTTLVEKVARYEIH